MFDAIFVVAFLTVAFLAWRTCRSSRGAVGYEPSLYGDTPILNTKHGDHGPDADGDCHGTDADCGGADFGGNDGI